MVFEPRKTVKWARTRRREPGPFFAEYPPYSIAMDGYCWGAPRLSEDGLRLNINHHEECDRIGMRSSCYQALCHVNMGLFDTFTRHGRPYATVYCNDNDYDVTYATYVLRHPQHIVRPMLKQLIQLEDLLDMSAGLYPIKKRWHLLKKLLWTCEPYSDARADGSLHTMNGDEMHATVDRMHRRIRKTLFGSGKEVEPDTRFEILEDFGTWAFIKEIGANARIGIGQKGIKAFASLVSSDGDHCRVVLARRSRHVRNFPLDQICKRLNEAEGVTATSTDTWGGNADNVIASPRKSGSHMKPEDVVRIIRECCDAAAP